jgi:hypothetical protein
MEYINRLDNFDGPQIALIAIRDDYQLYEEGFAIYKKFKLHEVQPSLRSRATSGLV